MNNAEERLSKVFIRHEESTGSRLASVRICCQRVSVADFGWRKRYFEKFPKEILCNTVTLPDYEFRTLHLWRCALAWPVVEHPQIMDLAIFWWSYVIDDTLNSFFPSARAAEKNKKYFDFSILNTIFRFIGLFNREQNWGLLQFIIVSNGLSKFFILGDLAPGKGTFLGTAKNFTVRVTSLKLFLATNFGQNFTNLSEIRTKNMVVFKSFHYITIKTCMISTL